MMRNAYLVCATALFLMLAIVRPTLGEEVIGSGLEADNYKEVVIWVKSLDSEAKKMGLNSNEIERRVAARLAAGGLEPVIKRILAINLVDTCLYVAIIVAGDTVNMSVDFKRYATYYTSGQKEYKAQISTWSESLLGTAKSADDILVHGIDPLVDKFIELYKLVNEKRQLDAS